MAGIYEDSQLTDFKGDVRISDREILTQRLNFVRSLLLTRIANYHDALCRFKLDPKGGYEVQGGPRGKMWISYAGLIGDRVPAIIEAKAICDTYEMMLKELDLNDNLDAFMDMSKYVPVSEEEIDGLKLKLPEADEEKKD